MFSVLSWNVEHFKGGASRVAAVAAHIKSQNPDVFGLFEVEGADVLGLMKDHFPQYDFHITDGPQDMEIIVAHRQGKFTQIAFTQKREFQAFNPKLRPGALLTLRTQGELYNLLFLHTDSGTTAPDFGNRQEMVEKIANLKKAIDKLAQGAGRLIVMGDLNTMGLFFPTKKKADQRVSAVQEIKALDDAGGKMKMSLLAKEFHLTFNNGSLTSDLDHVLASDVLNFEQLGAAGAPFVVSVRGWQQLSGQARKNFIDTISDHCSLLVKVKK
jgi:endonuclease/exonuclease/phosphatase family metal-dependent hydrolase